MEALGSRRHTAFVVVSMSVSEELEWLLPSPGEAEAVTARVGWLSCHAERHLEVGMWDPGGPDETEGSGFGQSSMRALCGCSYLLSCSQAPYSDQEIKTGR